METFENNDLDPRQEAPQPSAPAAPETPQPETPPQGSPYSGTGTGRKESPYANSPYEMNHPPRSEYRYQPQSAPAPRPPKKPRQPGKGRNILSIVLILLLLGGMIAEGLLLYNALQESNRNHAAQVADLTGRIQKLEGQLQNPETPAAPGSNGPSRPADGSQMTPAQLYEACVDSVVAISTSITANSFYGVSEGSSSGSGFILSSEGYVVTNYHVVENATAVEVILHDGTKYDADVVGADTSNDLAVLKLTEEAEGLTPAVIGSSSQLNIGDMVVAIGNPLGELASTQTVGYVSGINREVTTDNTIINMIQTDAAINPGNSGGPLFNMYGQVIGITTAKYSGTTGSGASIEGIGFAIPIDDVQGMIADLVDYGYVTGAYLGVTVQNMDPTSAQMYDLPMGAYVVSVVEGGSADRAGVQEKDIIIALGDYKVGTINELTRSLRHFKAGDETTITVARGGQEKVLNITLDEKPQDLNAIPEPTTQMPSSGSYDEWYDFFRPYFGD